MAKDARIEAVIGRWAPGFISNGVPLQDYQDVTGGLESWDDWCRAWSARAAVHEDMGRKALAAGNTISAAQHLDTAAVLYHFAKFVFVQDMDQLKATHKKAVECRNLALPHMDPPGERVAIPYEGKELYGVLRKPKGIAKPPIVVMCMGMDSAKEEMSTNEADFHKRGLATLTFDGPGQGEAEYDFPITPEYEKPAGAVLDYVETRDDLDSGNIGIWGVSFGGYYAPRAAAFDKRIKACIGICGPFSFGEPFREGTTQEVFTARAHCKTPEEAQPVADRVDLTDCAKNITCPVFIIGGELDTLTPPEHQERLVKEVSGPAELLIVKDGNHVVNNLRHMYSPQVGDWMAGHLGGQTRY